MHQRQLRHVESRAALAFVLALVAILAPRAGHAQGQCATAFQEQTSGPVTDQSTVCGTAVANKCTFQLKLCVNQAEAGCTPKDLKKKTIHASSLCAGGIGKVKVKANGTSSVCGSFAGVKVKTKKHGTKAASCKIHAKAGQSRSTITFLCEPQSGVCPGVTTTTMTATTTTTTTLPCTCATSSFTRLSFTTVIGSGNCGTVQLSNGNVSKNLTCGGLYTGSGNNSVPLPYAVPDMGSSLTALGPCSGTTLTLANVRSSDPGANNRNCTSVGCLFGPPLPIPNTGSTPTSVCVINTVTADASGTADCSSGASSLSLPLNSEIFLDGDLLLNRPGIQVCPVCLAGACVGDGAHNGIDCTMNSDCGTGTCATGNTCHGGPNDGLACTPADSVIGTLGDFPTTHDCPPPMVNDIGGLPIAFALTTGTMSKTAQTISGQNNVFCGFCRDQSAAGTGCFEGDAGAGCPANSACTGAGVPFNCCAGVGTGSCDQPAPKACTAATDCTDGSGSWPDCQQRDPGAFGPAGGGAHTITVSGTTPGDLTDGAGHASTLVSIFCIQPTFNATVDAAGDLPGPGAVSLPGTAQLQ